MRYSVVFLLALFATAVNAHFQLQFPPPRGVFNATNESMFCDAYPNPSANRTQFPLSGGFYTLKAGHPHPWIAGVLVSTAQNATSFTDFSQVNTLGHGDGAGIFCLPLDFSKSNVTGLQAGQNITLQILFNGGDGNLYQCADLTLASGLDLSGSVSCSNSTTNSTSNSTSDAGSSFVGSFSLLSAMAGVSGVFLLEML